MRIALIWTRSPVPAFSGSTARVSALCSAIQEAGHELHFIHLAQTGISGDARSRLAEKFGQSKVHVLGWRPRVSGRLWRVRDGLRRRWNLPTAGLVGIDHLFDLAVLPQLREIAERERFDAVFVEYVFYTRAFEAFRPQSLCVVDTHDIMADRRGRLMTSGLRDDWFWLKPLDERLSLERADVVLAIQHEEAGILRERLSSKVHVQTLGHMIAPRSLGLRPAASACFVGSRTPSNIQALHYLLEEILPRIRASEPDFLLHVAGSICEAVSLPAGVVAHGIVPDLDDIYARAPVMINPVRAGTGQNIKMLEAMAAAIPTVSTRTGARGFLPGDLGGVVVIDDYDAAGFAAAIVRLISDPSEWERRRAAQAASAHAWAARQRVALAGILTRRPRAQEGRD